MVGILVQNDEHIPKTANAGKVIQNHQVSMKAKAWPGSLATRLGKLCPGFLRFGLNARRAHEVKVQVFAESSLKKFQRFGIFTPVPSAIVPNAAFRHFSSENITKKGTNMTYITI